MDGPYRENTKLSRIATYARTPVLPSRIAVALFELLILAFVATWNFASMRSQPSEHTVRVYVPVPGPVRVVEVPAPPPPRCQDFVAPFRVRDTTQQRCPNDAVMHVTPPTGDSDFALLECHCPRTQGTP